MFIGLNSLTFVDPAVERLAWNAYFSRQRAQFFWMLLRSSVNHWWALLPHQSVTLPIRLK
jgi:hypothetical protein